ncbi:translation initiation factor IF-2-like [Harpia harpyja]|uniref:translation initiation factor IF-2-like n=1 Tax=Harpia harpyja TaxID=202280 RepID=UPI0022B0CEC2|nr:translation initiation factor IF-2-like [Harpia harpyja]
MAAPLPGAPHATSTGSEPAGARNERLTPSPPLGAGAPPRGQEGREGEGRAGQTTAPAGCPSSTAQHGAGARPPASARAGPGRGRAAPIKALARRSSPSCSGVAEDAAEAEGAGPAGDLMGGRVRHAVRTLARFALLREGGVKGILVDKTLLNNYLDCCAAQRIKLIDSV